MRLIPASSAASTTGRDLSRSSRPPKLFAPRPTTETVRPERPSWRYRMPEGTGASRPDVPGHERRLKHARPLPLPRRGRRA